MAEKQQIHETFRSWSFVSSETVLPEVLKTGRKDRNAASSAAAQPKLFLFA
jgi:hypothetical protein